MSKTICPHCKKAFQMNDSEFASLLKQFSDQEFEDILRLRLDVSEKDKEAVIKLVRASLKRGKWEKLELEIEEALKDNPVKKDDMGYCHIYWDKKKEILWNKYHIR